ncbi:MAG: AraC family transcriptional regulator [Ottowia sp.]|uniref:AraC family transcriptional regulator n=1 Tax=Ottowia sp. TaxID=1898956 RepID=UPI0039E488F4
MSYVRVAESLGLDARGLAAEAGIRAELLTTPDLMVRARSLFRLKELAAQRSGALDFGLRLARERINFSYLGALGALAREEPDVRSMLRLLANKMHLHSAIATVRLAEAADLALVEIAIDPDGENKVMQSTEYSLGMLCLMLRQMLGQSWRPAQVHVIHQQLGTLPQYRAVFGCPMKFGASANLLVMSSRDLDRPNPFHHAGLRAYVTMAPTSSLASGPEGCVAPRLVAQLVGQLLPNGNCSAAQVASGLGIDRRTLHRHLARAGTSYTEVLQQTRAALARQYVAAGALGMTEIAELLGFSALANFSRWFKTQLGSSPRVWQASQKDAGSVEGDPVRVITERAPAPPASAPR